VSLLHVLVDTAWAERAKTSGGKVYTASSKHVHDQISSIVNDANIREQSDIAVCPRKNKKGDG
jgi:hypothetical protein